MPSIRTLLQSHKGLDFIVAFSLMAGVGMLTLYLVNSSEQQVEGQMQFIDGDSLILNGVEIRLSGIDAPEISQNCTKNGQKWQCGRDASAHLKRLIAKGKVKCAGWQHDQYDRLLAKCTSNGVELNRVMVRDGWAIGFGEYLKEESIAKESKRGIWAGKFDRPQNWRRHERIIDQWST